MRQARYGNCDEIRFGYTYETEVYPNRTLLGKSKQPEPSERKKRSHRPEKFPLPARKQETVPRFLRPKAWNVHGMAWEVETKPWDEETKPTPRCLNRQHRKLVTAGAELAEAGFAKKKKGEQGGER